MINITSIIISAIVMTIVGFITAKIWGFDIPKVVSDIAAIVAILILTLPIIGYNPQGDIEELIQFLQNYIMTVFVSIIIPALIGDAIGTAVSKLIEEFGAIWQN